MIYFFVYDGLKKLITRGQITAINIFSPCQSSYNDIYHTSSYTETE